jgi:hypothetical protein
MRPVHKLTRALIEQLCSQIEQLRAENRRLRLEIAELRAVPQDEQHMAGHPAAAEWRGRPEGEEKGPPKGLATRLWA